jgi:hypothetical protein
MFMNTTSEIDPAKINDFKKYVIEWLDLDRIINEQEKRIKELKKKRNKELEPLITSFMSENNIIDLNTNNGKIRCTEKKTKKGFNKVNIKNNLSKFINDGIVLDTALNEIVNNRETVISYKLKIVK